MKYCSVILDSTVIQMSTSGHTDVLMGALCTNNEEIAKKLNFFQLGLQLVCAFN